VRILIADDDDVLRLRLQAMLAKRGYEVMTAADGTEAWDKLQRSDPPRLAILDWMMSQMDGTEVCRRVRAAPALKAMYLILLTSRESKEHVIQGLEAGANDYIVKPFDPEELRARVEVGVQVVRLQCQLKERVQELEEALVRVTQLQGLLPICAYCKSIRDDNDYWHRVESYISQHSAAHFSHGICPDCYDQIVVPQLAQRTGLAS
jgi:DNA-binding response OmpR family regulator